MGQRLEHKNYHQSFARFRIESDRRLDKCFLMVRMGM
jgi:hypothetical protein